MTTWTEFAGQTLAEKNPAKATWVKRKAMFEGENSGNILSFLYAQGLIPVVKIDPDIGLLRLVYIKGEAVRVKKPFLWNFDLYAYGLKIKRNKRNLQIWVPLFRKVTSFAADSTLRMIESMKAEMASRSSVSVDSARREVSLVSTEKASNNRSYLARRYDVQTERKIDTSVSVSRAIVEVQMTPDMMKVATIEAEQKSTFTAQIKARHALLVERSMA